MGWIAKAKYDPEGKTYGKVYNSLIECQKYIDNELKEEMEKQKDNMYRWCYEHGNRDKKLPEKYDDLNDMQKTMVKLIVTLNVWNNPILCWNIEKKRFVDGFDW